MLFRSLIKAEKPLPITDKKMTRFWITLNHAVEFVLESFELMQGGELYVPQIPSMKIVDLANALSEKVEIVEIGIRPGEKLHEEIISPDDSRRTTRLHNRYVVSPIFAEWGYKEPVGEKVQDGFSYRSDSNSLWLTQRDIQEKLSEILKHDSLR